MKTKIEISLQILLKLIETNKKDKDIFGVPTNIKHLITESVDITDKLLKEINEKQ